MAVRSTLALKLGDKMQVQFQTNPSGVTAVVRNRKDDCFGLEFLPQLPAESARHSCSPKILLAGLHRKLLEIEQVQREIDALNLSILLLADDEKKNPESSLQRRPKVEMRPWPSLS